MLSYRQVLVPRRHQLERVYLVNLLRHSSQVFLGVALRPLGHRNRYLGRLLQQLQLVTRSEDCQRLVPALLCLVRIRFDYLCVKIKGRFHHDRKIKGRFHHDRSIIIEGFLQYILMEKNLIAANCRL